MLDLHSYSLRLWKHLQIDQALTHQMLWPELNEFMKQIFQYLSLITGQGIYPLLCSVCNGLLRMGLWAIIWGPAGSHVLYAYCQKGYSESGYEAPRLTLGSFLFIFRGDKRSNFICTDLWTAAERRHCKCVLTCVCLGTWAWLLTVYLKISMFTEDVTHQSLYK